VIQGTSIFKQNRKHCLGLRWVASKSWLATYDEKGVKKEYITAIFW